MNQIFESFVASGKALGAKSGLRWDVRTALDGKVEKAERWNLTALCGMASPPTIWLSDLGFDAKCLSVLNQMRTQSGEDPLADGSMSSAWCDLYKAVVLNELLVKRNKPQHAIINIGRYIRMLATCAEDTPPWELNPDIVQRAFNAALGIGESGKLAANLSMVVRIVFDALSLSEHKPLAGYCKPYPNKEARSAQAKVDNLLKRDSAYLRTDQVRKELADRKGSAKLPEERAFWELVRIVFTEQPKTFSDAIRFGQVKLAIATGFRIGENAMLPSDWERWREYVDAAGNPAGEKGGISRSLMIRHFAEKQATDLGRDGIVLYETAQHVPDMFNDLVLGSLQQVARMTAPMRTRLRLQITSKRLLPEFQPNQLVPAWDLYTRMSGSAHFVDDELPEKLVSSYRSDFNPDVLEQIRDWQCGRLDVVGISRAAKSFWWDWARRGLRVRKFNGDLIGKGIDWREAYFRIDEVEEFVAANLPTKLPDWEAFALQDGSHLHACDLMFLMPIRALIENRNGGIVDVNRYFAIGRVAPSDLQFHLGGNKENNLFQRYGRTDEDRQLKLNTHSLRHLQNAELFRLGVADTIITKRFNRSSVAQSYTYDHRSLAESLAHIDLPAGAANMGPRAQEALRMIRAQKVSGPIVDEFLRVQAEQGDDAAFNYLDAEADGLHVTPYGFCLNSFTVDPCPKHLECFNGCRHLTRSPVPEEQQNLERLRDRFARVIAKIEATAEAARSIGWKNQLAHARTRLENIEATLAASPGELVFPEGDDLHRSFEKAAGQTVLDTKKAIRRAE